jgi:uncharacterized protein
LQFNVAQLLKEPTGGNRHYDVEIKTIGDFDDAIKVIVPLIGHVDILRTGPDILVTGLLQTMIQKNCGRCLTAFIRPISIELEEEFYPSVDILTGTVLPKLPEIDQTNYISELHILDLTEIVQQEIFLEGDGMRYCRLECKGLCPHCGQDRNIDPCNCEDEVIDPRWAKLLATQLED